MLNGTSRPGATSSSHANRRKSPKLGQTPSHCGYCTRGDRPPVHGRVNFSANPKVELQGLMSGQILPTNAVRKPNPTHQITQTATGVMFLKVAGLPTNPATTSNASA